jgi:hypothetical protein
MIVSRVRVLRETWRGFEIVGKYRKMIVYILVLSLAFRVERQLRLAASEDGKYSSN